MLDIYVEGGFPTLAPALSLFNSETKISWGTAPKVWPIPATKESSEMLVAAKKMQRVKLGHQFA